MRKKITNVLSDYRSNQTESTNLEMTIILTDDDLVSERSHIFSFLEKEEVGIQVKEILKEDMTSRS